MKDTEAEDNKDILEEEDVNKEEAALNSLNAIRIQRGKTPFKKFPGSHQKPNRNRNIVSNGAQPKTTNRELMKCRYCKKSRHMQKECYKWIKENGAMLNGQGKQYRANEVVEKNVGAISASGYSLCVGCTVVPSMVPNIKTTPQLINNIRKDVCDQVEYKINSLHSRPLMNYKIKNSLTVRALYDTGADVNCMSAATIKKNPVKNHPTKLPETLAAL